MKGIEREIDNVGRVVIPMEFRKELGVRFNSKVLIFLSNDEIIIKSKISRCALCGEKVEENEKVRLCDKCILEVKSL